jgi:hypothetical protein
MASELESVDPGISPMNLKVPDNSAGTGFDGITVTGMSMSGQACVNKYRYRCSEVVEGTS